MSKLLKITFLAHTIVAFVIGAPLLLAPGRFLALFNWAPVDPLLSRILGAALLGLAWSSLRGYQQTSREKVALLIEAEAVFCTLAVVGLLRNMLGSGWPFIVWLILGVLAVFAVLWLINGVKK